MKKRNTEQKALKWPGTAGIPNIPESWISAQTCRTSMVFRRQTILARLLSCGSASKKRDTLCTLALLLSQRSFHANTVRTIECTRVLAQRAGESRPAATREPPRHLVDQARAAVEADVARAFELFAEH